MSEGCFYFQVEFDLCSYQTSSTSQQTKEYDSLLSVHPFLIVLTELTLTKELLFSKNNISLGSLWRTTTPVLDSADRGFGKGGQNANRPCVRAEQSTVEASIWG